jgi:hypothetical protein
VGRLVCNGPSHHLEIDSSRTHLITQFGGGLATAGTHKNGQRRLAISFLLIERLTLLELNDQRIFFRNRAEKVIQKQLVLQGYLA